MHIGKNETWINARAKVNRGWLPMPRHAEPGRHAGKRSTLARDILTRAAYLTREFTGARAHAWHAEVPSVISAR